MKHLKTYKVFENFDDFSNFIKDFNPNIDFDYTDIPVDVLNGKLVFDIIINQDKTEMLIIIEGDSEYEIYKFYHEQDCCESVYLYDINGDLNDLVGEVLNQVEEVSRVAKDGEFSDGTWTFYKLATRKGYVTLRWLGESNGYYSEEMSFVRSTNIIESYEDLIKLLYSK